MNYSRSAIWLLVVLMLLISSGPHLHAQNTTLTHPDDYFGFHPGSDYELFDYQELIGYLKQLDRESEGMILEEIGTSPMGKPMYLAIISDPVNINNLETLREINHELALNPTLSESERSRMSREGKVFVVATLSMHSSEVGPSQAAPLIAHTLLSSDDPEVRGWSRTVGIR